MSGFASENHIAEQLLKAIIDTSIDGIILIDKFGIICQMNPSAIRIFGYSDDSDLLGRNISVLMPARDASQHDGYLSNYLQSGERRIIGIGRELKGLKKNGEVFPFRLGVSEIRIGDQVLFNGIIHDLSDQKRAEERIQHYMRNLESMVDERTREIKKANELLYAEIEEREKAQEALVESQQLYQIIARNFPDGTINVFDRKLRYVFAEGKELRMAGTSIEDLPGTAFLDRIDVEYREKSEKELKKVFKGESVQFEIMHHQKHYVLNGVPLRSVDGDIDRILVVEHNITQRKTLESEMQKALETERMLNELKSRFISTASHEFRTPLSAISSSAQIIGKYVETDDQSKREKHINRIKANVQNLTNILEDFLSLEKLNEGATHFRPEAFDLCQFLLESIEDMMGSLKEGQTVNLQNPEGPCLIFTDKQFIRNIVNNLVSNASKYSDEGKCIDLTLKYINNSFMLLVRDYGIGIPKEDQVHLFERFFRASNCGNVKGTGLGLHIVKKYVELMGGDITFESAAGKGTTFILTIPQKHNS